MDRAPADGAKESNMAAKQNREAVAPSHPHNGAHPGPGDTTEYRQGGLHQQLLRSHQYIALLGLGLLLIMLVAGLWVRSRTLRLAHLHAPAARASTLVLSGIDRSFAALRGWIQLGEPGFKVARAQAWNEIVWPALDELEVLHRHWTHATDRRRLAEVRRLLEALHGVQWWIEDVAQTPGNRLTRVQHGLRTYEAFADKALALLQSGPRNVAKDLLVSQAMPLASQASALLQDMSTRQDERMRQEASFTTLISNLSLAISLVLIAAMIVGAVVLARRSTERIMQPVTTLLRATRQLAAGTLTEDIPVRSHDELGQLTASFNAMRTSLQRNRELDDRNHFIRETLGRYVSDEVATRILDDPGGLRFGGETRQVTMLMSDLRGFTALAERLPPDQTLAFLNRYLESMVDIIMAHDGTINEILGDGIFVLFGAPIQRLDDARRAVACAVAMQLAINEMNAQHEQEGLPEMEMGIAIHTGEVVVGNIGSQKRTKYAAVGSNVNLIGRIESYTIGGQILISEKTRQEVAALLHISGHIQIEPKGVSEPLTVYDVRGIDSPYNLHLPEPADTLVVLDVAIALRYTVLEEKFVGRTVFPGQFVKLSAKGGQIYASWPAPPLSNLKIWLTDASGATISGELYAKVIDVPQNPREGFKVRFTSVSPAVSAYLQHALSMCPTRFPLSCIRKKPIDTDRQPSY
jgi:class 3 adenylate cyclase